MLNLIRRLSQKIRTLDMFSNVSLLKKTQNSLSKNTEGVFSKKLDFCACVCYLCEGSLNIRLTEAESEAIKKCAAMLGKSRTDAIMQGIYRILDEK